MHSWRVSGERRFVADVIINVALYVPLGMSAFLALSNARSRWLRFAIPVALGAMLSASIEMAQLFVPGRDCSALDLIDNIAGSALGLPAGLLFRKLARPVRFRVPDRAALAVLFCWVGSLLFPVVPVMWLAVLHQKLVVLSTAPVFDWVRILSGCGAWLAAGYLMQGAGFRHTGRWLGLSVLLIPLQFLIVTRQPLAADVIGAGLGTILFVRTRYLHWELWIAAAFMAVVVARGTTPLRFAGDPQPFVMIPFGGFLQMGWQSGLQVLLEKSFWYGAAIWLVRRVTGRLRTAGAMVCAVLLVMEIGQRWMPGHTAEITDPLLALLLAFGMWLL